MITVQFIVSAGMILLVSIVMHEFGHWIYIKRLKKYSMRPTWFRSSMLSFGFEMEYPGRLSIREKINFLLFGIGFGFVPIIIALGLPHRGYMFLIPMYVFGCMHDYKQLLELVAKEAKRLDIQIGLENGKDEKRDG